MIDISSLSANLSTAYAAFLKCFEDAENASEMVILSQLKLEEAQNAVRGQFTANPKAMGNNQDEVKRFLDAHTPDELRDFIYYSLQHRQMKYALRRAEIEVEGWRAQLRCLEVAAGLTNKR